MTELDGVEVPLGAEERVTPVNPHPVTEMEGESLLEDPLFSERVGAGEVLKLPPSAPPLGSAFPGVMDTLGE